MVYGLSDKSVDGLDVRHNSNPPIAYPEELGNESAGGSGARMHHKFVVIDFNTPAARVYTGSHNFSNAADTKNAENLFLIRDPRVATAYMIEAVAMFDHVRINSSPSFSSLLLSFVLRVCDLFTDIGSSTRCATTSPRR